MKNVSYGELTTHKLLNDTQILNVLREIKDEVKNPLTREEGYKRLVEIPVETLSVGLEIYYLYIQAKYYVLKYKASSCTEIDFLERADDFLDDAVVLSQQEKVTIKSKKILFTRAHVKVMIGRKHKSVQVRERFISKAKFLVEMSLRHYPMSSSFNWLANELSKV